MLRPRYRRFARRTALVLADVAVLCALAAVWFGWPPWIREALRWLAVHFWSWLGPQLTLVTVILLFLAPFIVHYVLRELLRDAILIGQFEVPPRLEEAGLTPQALASRVGSAIEELRIRSITESIWEDVLNYSKYPETRPGDVLNYSHGEKLVDLEIPQMKMGLRALIEFLRDYLRWPVLRISGDVVESPSTQLASGTQLTLTVYRCWGHNQVKVGQAVVKPEETDLLVKHAAELSLEYVYPDVSGRRLLLRARDSQEEALKIAKRMVDESSNMPWMRRKRVEEQIKQGHQLWALLLFERGEAERERGEPERSRAEYEESRGRSEMAVELDPRFAAGYVNWGKTLGRLERYQEAFAKFKKAIKIDERQVPAYFEWGYALRRYADDERDADKKERAYTKAIAKFDETIKRDPKFAEAYYNWGNILLRHGHYEDAIAKFKETIKIDPKHAYAYYDWGCALLNQGSIGQAQEKFEKAIKIRPSLEPDYRALATNLDSSGDES